MIKATANLLNDLSDFIEIESLSVVPVTNDLIVINTLVGGKRGIFRVHQRMIWPNMVYLWVKLVEDEDPYRMLCEALDIPIVSKIRD